MTADDHPARGTDDGPTVRLGSAIVHGTWHRDDERAVGVFKGIRYATAARFAAPEPVGGSDGTIDATSYGPQCPQLAGTLERLLGASSLPVSEDCLHLNVTTPACDGGRRPVLVWFHGGAFVTGSGAMPWYHGASLARLGDVVVVTCNYRLGALGFAGTSNAGLADQVAVLQWVSDHVRAFGGDPDRVTIFGESAGGASVLALIAVPAARSLFRAAWSMSPSIPQLRSVERAQAAERALLDAAGAADRDALAALPLATILEAQRTLLADPSGALTAFAPTPDGSLLPGPVLDRVASDPRPLVVGTNRDEMHLFTAFDPRHAELDTDADAFHRAVERRFAGRTTEAITRYRAARPGDSDAQLVSAIQTDETFRMPAARLLRSRDARRSPSWSYWFTYASPAFSSLLGSCHGLDIPFAFHNLDRPGVEMFTGDGAERSAVADEFAGALIRFAHTGDPGWDRFEPVRRPTRRIDVESSTIEDPEPELHDLWDPVAPDHGVA